MAECPNRNGQVTLRALVCDDEPVAREYLKLVLSRIDGVEVVGEAADVSEFLRKVGDAAPDVVFLDIHLPDASGMDAASALARLSRRPEIVFVTGYEEHAVEAFDLDACDYVMKPFDQERLARTIERLRASAAAKPSANGAEASGFARLPIRDRESVKLVDPADIYYVRTEGRKTRVRTAGESFLTTYTLGELESRLHGHNFFRANEGCLVNLDCVQEVMRYGPRSYELLLNDPDHTFVPLSRSRAQKLREMLDL